MNRVGTECTCSSVEGDVAHYSSADGKVVYIVTLLPGDEMPSVGDAIIVSAVDFGKGKL